MSRPRPLRSVRPVSAAVRGGTARRRVQTAVIGLVMLISTAASVLALGLVVDSNAPFVHAFAAQRGAHVTITIDAGKATQAQLTVTRRLAGVSAMTGPFPEATIGMRASVPGIANLTLPQATLVGRAVPGGALDVLVLDAGRWVRRPGEIVISRDLGGPALSVGQRITVTTVPGAPSLTVVGIAKSITGTADGWVVPAEIPALRAPGTLPAAQMLYRFRTAATAADIRSDIAAVSADLPRGAVTGSQSYLPVKLKAAGSIAPIVPFVVAFGILGLVMSVLIVMNVVSGAVVAGYRRIGILKSIGFTRGQVVAAYVGVATVPAVAGCLTGAVLGNLLAIPLLGQTANVYGVGTLTVPVTVDVIVPLVILVLVGIAALLPALRGGGLSAVQVIAIGRAPRQNRGYTAHRLLGRLRLPRPVTIGLAAPFARPARSAVTLAAILFGATAVTFAVGLNASLDKVAHGITHSRSEPVQVGFLQAGGKPDAGRASVSSGQQRTVEAALRTEPGTAHFAAEAVQPASVVGLSQPVAVHAFRGSASWTGYDRISGRWYRGPGEVDVPTYFLTLTGKTVGDTVTITYHGAAIPVRIVGEVFDPGQGHALAIYTDWQTLADANPRLSPDWYDVALRPGTSPQGYANALGGRLGPAFAVSLAGNLRAFGTIVGLIATLTLLLALVAGLGVLNTVVLSTRERVHDLGVFKAVGMTPRQTLAMVVCWVAGIGFAAGVIAVPAGIALHTYILPIMAAAADTRLPASFLNVYHGPELAFLTLAGLLIACCGALLPASWAAGMRTASALRAE